MEKQEKELNLEQTEEIIVEDQQNHTVNDESTILEPGWRAPIWFENYTKIFTDARVREPLVRVFIWTIILGWLCSKGYVNVSWFLLLLPYILIVLAMFKIFRSNELNQLIQTAQL